jgi:hypothetical protein
MSFDISSNSSQIITILETESNISFENGLENILKQEKYPTKLNFIVLGVISIIGSIFIKHHIICP